MGRRFRGDGEAVPLLAMRGSSIVLGEPTDARKTDFLRATGASRKFHAGLVSPPATDSDYAEYLERCEGSRHEGRLVIARATSVCFWPLTDPGVNQMSVRF